ncbi:MAG: tRNA (N6-isopentenyl adenosine(37)-C2)-methylthiotransferase MiaB [Filifactoraceae bacterium]
MKREIKVVTTEQIIEQEVFMNKINSYLKSNNYINNKYFIKTYGCQMNEHDSENLKGMFLLMGYTEAENEIEADIIIFNTCAIRENAELKVYGNLGSLKPLKEKNKKLIIAVCGCMMQQEHVVKEIKSKFSHVGIVFGTHNLFMFPQMLYNYINDSTSHIYNIWDVDGNVIEGLPIARKFEVKAFVNIMYGCNNFCTYCVVPYTRGRERSREPEDVLNEVKLLVDSGVKEITLLGQNVNSYGKTLSNPITFADLLKRINDIDGLVRIKFMTSHPKDLSDELIEAMARLDKVCESLHLPFQAGSSKVLKSMNRHYTKEDYIFLVEKIRKLIPNIAITTDIMVGFPGETEDDFLDTLDLVKKVKFDSAFTFLYSVRKGTVAEKMENHVPDSVKKERFDKLLSLIQEQTKISNYSYQGKVVEVLVEGIHDKDSNNLIGRNLQGKLVVFPANNNLIGEIVKVKITKPKPFSLYGELV